MRNFLRNRRGSILIEAAIAFPVLVVILLGMVEFGVAYTVKRRNAQVASTVADLVAQVSSITTSNLQDIANIGATILAPYPYSALSPAFGSPASCRTPITRPCIGAAPRAISAPPAGGTYSLPAGLVSQSQAIVIAEANYNFTPVIGEFLTGVITFSAQAYNKPRGASSVTLQGCAHNRGDHALA